MLNGTGEPGDRDRSSQTAKTAVVASLAMVLALALVILVSLFGRQPNSMPIEIIPPPPTPTRSPTPTPGPLTVHVTGAVVRPGLVQVPAGARVQDALLAAGGPTADADLDATNLAAPLSDGQQVRIPATREAIQPVVLPAGSGGTTPLRVNINTATAAELIALPGVGEATAAKIITYREEHHPFAQIEDILNVSGIGEAEFDGFKDLITVGP